MFFFYFVERKKMSDKKENVKNEDVVTEGTTPDITKNVSDKVSEAPKVVEKTKADLEAEALELGVDEAVVKAVSNKAGLEALIAMQKSQQAQVEAVQEQLADVEAKADELDDPATKTRVIVDDETGATVVKKAVKDNKKSDAKKYLSKRERMKAHLDAQEKVEVYVPRDFGEKKGTTLAVQLNGYRLNILKGVMVRVPKQIAEVIKESYDMTEQAGDEFLMDREKVDTVTGKTVNVSEMLN